MNWQPRPLTDREKAALRPWKLGCILTMVLFGSSFVGIVLYICLSEDPNVWILVGWMGAYLIVKRLGFHFWNRRFDQIIESVSESDDTQ